MPNYFPDVVSAYTRLGYTILPLPENAKQSPPAGYTGHQGETPTPEQYREWTERFPRGNTAFRPPDGLIGFDIDTYTSGDKVKDGKADWAVLVARHGDPGPTATSTARDPEHSGIRWYTTPRGLKWPGSVGPAIEVVQHVHRYAVVYPSMHPETGTQYKWYNADGGEMMIIPTMEHFTALPETWVRALTNGEIYRAPDVRDMDLGEIDEWAEQRPQGDPCREMQAQLDRTVDALADNGAHDTANNGVWALLNLACDGHRGLIPAIEKLGIAFYTEASTRRDGVQYEWERMVQGGVAKVTDKETATHCWCNWKIAPPSPVVKAVESAGSRQYVLANGRKATLTRLSDITMKRAKWLWDGRIAMGSLALVAGQPGMGKSTFVYWLVAELTKGGLKGEYLGKSKDVIICATEDDYEVTIKPRLVAAGANTERVWRIELASAEDIMEGMNLVEDLETIRQASEDLDLGLVILDPLMSRLGGKDSHKDSEVREALEPLTSLARECDFGVIGLMHFNKSGRSDPMSLLMGSAAFGAVARSVHIVMQDPEDETFQRRLVGVVKNNLGSISGPGDHDLATYAFTIESVTLETEDDDAECLITSRLNFEAEKATTHIKDALETMAAVKKDAKPKKETKLAAAQQWLETYFNKHDRPMLKAAVLEAADKDMLSNHSVANLQRAIQDDLFSTETRYNHTLKKVEAWWGLAGSFD